MADAELELDVKLGLCQGRSMRAGWAGVTYTVGMYSPGKAFVVYEMRRHVWRRGYQHLVAGDVD